MRNFLAILAIIILGLGGYWAYQHFGARPAALDPIEAELAFFEALKDSRVDAPAAGEAEVLALADAIGGFAAVDIGSFESEGEGAVARDVTLTMLDDAEVGVRVDELRLWGVDLAALGAFQSGEGEGGLVARRIDAQGIEWFGFEKASSEALNAYSEAVIGAVGSVGGDEINDQALEALRAQSINRYGLAATRMIVDGVSLYPLSSDAPADDTPPLMRVLQMLARWSRIASVDAAAVYELTTEFDMEQAGNKSSMTMSLPLSGYRGYERGDIAAIVARDVAYTMDMELPAPDPEAEGAAPISMQMSGGIERQLVSGLRLAKLYDYLERGALPPTSEHDVVSLGVWRILGEHIEMGGAPFYSITDARVDLSKFHWLVPTDIEFAADDIVYDVEGFVGYMKQIAALEGASSSADVTEQMDKVVEILKKYDLSAPAIDFGAKAHWNPENGEMRGGFDFGIDDFGIVEETAEYGFAGFDSFVALALAEGEELDQQAVAALLRDTFRIKHVTLALSDEGGVEKSFGLAVDFANLAPEGDANAMLRNADPEDLRQSSAAMIRLTSAQAAQAFPPAAEYLGAVADFIQKGGGLRAELAPPKPLTVADLEGLSAPGAEPQQVVDLFGFTLVYEPPAGAAAESGQQ